MATVAAASNDPILGRLVSSDCRKFQFCCVSGSIHEAQLGRLVCAEVGAVQVYALITNVEWIEAGLARQIAATPGVVPAIVTDGRNRVEGAPTITAWYVGYQNGTIRQTLPTQPPFALSEVWPCSQYELCQFTQRLSYLRLLYEARQDLPLAGLLAAHIEQAQIAQEAAGNAHWLVDVVAIMCDLLIGDRSQAEAMVMAIEERVSNKHEGAV